MDYVRLRATIQEYSENFEASFVDNVDTFIRLAESRILLRVRLPNFRKQSSGNTGIGTSVISTPTDFLAPDSLSMRELFGVRQSNLLFKDPEFLTECYQDPAGGIVMGLPRFYAMVNERTIAVAPAPDAVFIINLAYFCEPASIVDSGQTWLGDHFAHALISGALVEASTYMKTEDSLYVRYNQAFEKDLAMDQQFAKGRVKKDTYQEPDVRVKV